MTICPNLNNPDVAREFGELKDAIGEKAAYAVWSLNNGNAIDKAPNGEPSILFQSLLNNTESRETAIRAKAKTYGQNFRNWFGDWINNPEHASKAVDGNGEPQVLYHYTDEHFDSFDIDFFGQSDSGDHGRGFYFTNYGNNDYFLNDYGKIQIPVFLDIKNPVPFKITNQGERVSSVNDKDFNRIFPNISNKNNLENQIQTLKYSLENYSNQLNEYNDNFHKSIINGRINSINSQIKKLRNIIEKSDQKWLDQSMYADRDTLQEYDGVFAGLFETVVKSPNQIKSINNDGSFSDDPNIYHNISPRTILQWEDSKLEKEGRTKGSVERIARETKTGFGIRIGYYKDDNDKWHINTLGSTVDNDKIQRDTTTWSEDEVKKFADKLNEIFDNRFNIQYLSDDEWSNKGLNPASNSCISGSNVYLRKSKVNGQIAAEELLHTLVYNMKSQNSELFNNLLQRAKKDFPKLTSEIDKLYDQNKDEELVTQVLSRYVFNKYKQDSKSGIASKIAKFLKDFAHQIFAYFKSIPKFNVFFQKYDITVDNFTDRLNFEDLANIILNNDVRFIGLTSLPTTELRNNLSTQNTFIKNIYDSIDDINNQRDLFLQQQQAQYKANMGKDMEPSQINQLRTGYNQSQLKRVVQQTQEQFATQYGLIRSAEGYFYSKSDKPLDKLIVHVINSLDDDTFKAYRQHDPSNYRAVAGVQNKAQVLNTISQFIQGEYGVDLQTLDKALARDYIRAFWPSDLIQSALHALDNGHKTSEQLESELLDAITTEDWRDSKRNSKLQDIIKNFWQQLTNLVKSIFAKPAWTNQQKNDILNAVQAAFIYKDDLEISHGVQSIYDRADGNFQSSLFLTDQDKQILGKIKSGTQTRLKAALAKKLRNNSLVDKLRTELEILDQKSTESIDDIFSTLDEFVRKADQELSRTAAFIEKTTKQPIDTWDAEQLSSISTDLLGYYSGLLSNLHQELSDKNNAVHTYNEYRVQNDPNALNLQTYTEQLCNDISALREDYMNRIAKPMALNFIDAYVDANDTISDKQEFKRKARLFLDQDTRYGDLQAGEVLIGMASRSKSPLVRIVQNIIKSIDDEKGRITLKKGTELMRAYQKIGPVGKQMGFKNFQKQFLELDHDGIPTGYFVRDINEGQFLIDKDTKEKEIRDKLNANLPDDKKLTIDEEGNTVFPDEPDETADNSIYNQYMDELDKWLDKHCERRYKLEYYMKRRRYLHRSTILAQQQIQRQISTLLNKAEISNGFYDFQKLTKAERDHLNELRKQKRDLASHYIFNVDSTTGLLDIQEKTGEALRIADELSAWQTFLSKHVKYAPDWNKYNAQLNLIKDPAKRARFEKENTKTVLSQEFYNKLSSIGKKFDDKKLADLQRRHSEIVSKLKIGEGYQPYDLRKIGTGVNGDTSVWAELKRLEQAISDHRAELIKNRQYTSGDNSISFQDIAVMFNAMSFNAPNESDLQYIMRTWANAWTNNTNLRQVFMDLFTYTDEKGRIRYLNVFQQLGPREKKYLKVVPSSIYSSIDDSSDFKNENFDESNNKSLQAKASIYKNPEFEKIKQNKDVYNFYNMLRQTMAEANANIPQHGLYRDDLLPQITGRTMSVVGRSTGLKSFFKNIGYTPWETNMTAEYANNAGDVDMVTDVPRRPDGSIVSNVPIRFTQRLKNRALLTNDVIGSVLTYYDMAMNYALKSNALPQMENIARIVDPTQNVDKSKQLPQQYNKIRNLLDFGFYGKETTIGNIRQSKKRKAGEVKPSTDAGLIQKGKTIRRIVSVAMLGVNFTTIEIGYLDAMASAFTDAIGGKYMTKKDFVYGLAASAKHTFSCLGNLGKQTTNDWLIAAMQYNQLSKSNSEIFGNSDQSKWSRLFHEYLLMGGYTLTDYMVNGAVLEATYHHFRLMKDPSTGKNKFMSRSMAIKAYSKFGYTEKDIDKLWSKSKKTLVDAYEVKDGYFTVKDQYKDVVTKQLENLIQNRIKDRTAVYNGVIPQSEKAKLQQNVWGSYISLMRNFLINTYWERFSTGVDYMNEENGTPTWKSEYKRDDMGYEDLDTGEYTGALFKDFCRGMTKIFKMAGTLFSSKPREKLTENQSYAVKKCLSELAIIAGACALMVSAVAHMRSVTPPDDDEKVWTINLVNVDGQDKPVIDINWDAINQRNLMNFLEVKGALLATRFFNERITPWSPFTVTDLIKSPTVATSWFDNVGYVFTILQDLFKGRMDEEVTRAGYQHMSRGTRDILTAASFLGLNTLVKQWHTSGLKSTLNYYLGVTPINFIVPSASDYKKSLEGDDSTSDDSMEDESSSDTETSDEEVSD